MMERRKSNSTISSGDFFGLTRRQTRILVKFYIIKRKNRKEKKQFRPYKKHANMNLSSEEK